MVTRGLQKLGTIVRKHPQNRGNPEKKKKETVLELELNKAY